MPYEKYIPRRGPAGGRATVRILKNGDFSVSPGAFNKWFDGANHVELYFNPNAKKVGMKPKKQPTKASYKLRESPQGGDRRYVSGEQFLETYDISVEKATTYEAEWNDKEDLVEFKVK
ncbi:MAG: hypothetical protein R3199_11965 [Gemmatimonadota bacterium]|nr:hypothetical protein [Gemmatimonadota bacterium]